MALTDVDVVVVGAGPYGLSAVVKLRRANVDVSVFGKPMSFWREMPRGMLLRSNWGATSFVDREGPLTLDAYVAATGVKMSDPVPLESFVEYGTWVQESAVPDVDTRLVTNVRRGPDSFVVQLADGQELTARRVVVACGIGALASRPPLYDALPAASVSHTSDHVDLSVFSGQTVAIVGGGQSALESAALMVEAGAEVEVLVQRPEVVWLRWPPVKRRLGALGPILYAPTDVGPLWYSRLVSQPNLFRRLPRAAQTKIARRAVRPAGSARLRTRLGEERVSLGVAVVRAAVVDGRVRLELDDSSTRSVDHVLLGTGYRVDLERYDILDDDLIRGLKTVAGYPVLRRGLESSVPGLHFLGAPAAWSFGPIMRFVSGSWFGSAELAAQIARDPGVSQRSLHVASVPERVRQSRDAITGKQESD